MNSQNFQPSFKEIKKNNKDSVFSEFIDSTKLLYSNFKYGISMDFPDNWTVDMGVSEHTIIRGKCVDSSITFTINVFELKLSEAQKTTNFSIFDLKEDEKSFISNITRQLNTDIYNYATRKSAIKSIPSKVRTFNYKMQDLNNVYEMQTIMHQEIILPYIFTISLNIPKVFYDLKPEYYNQLFSGISFIRRNQ